MTDQSSLFDYARDEEAMKQAPGKPVALSVGAAVELINDQLFRIAGSHLVVEGEVAEFRVSDGKWVWFVLKDLKDGVVLRCFLTIYQLNVDVKDGDRIVVHATPKVYPRSGQLTLNVNTIEAAGEGGLKAALVRLQKQLQSEGFFDVSRKRPLPEIPSRIGLITSREAAAYSDFVRILNNRWGDIDVDLAHVSVQGERAVREICAALSHFNALADDDRPDVLVLTRGGGSLEDLMAFNAEAVVRAVFSSRIPIVVAVGHERDETLAEYAADVRASTPSNAAERLVPERETMRHHVETHADRLRMRADEKLSERGHQIERSVARMQSVMSRVRLSLARTVQSVEHGGATIRARMEAHRRQIEALVRLLRELDPTRVLQRGYAMVKKDGKIVRSAAALDKGDRIAVHLAEGRVDAAVL